MRKLRFAWVLAMGLVWLGGCASESKLGPNTGSPSFGEAPTNTAGNRLVEFEQFEICKDFAGPVDNPAPVRFNITVDIDNNGSIDQTFYVELRNGECREIWLNGGQGYDLVTVTEVVPAGFAASYVMTRLERTQLGGGGDQVVVGSSVASNTASRAFRGNAIGTVGVLVEFTNTRMQGCTLTQGYWKTHSIFGPAGPTDATWDLVGGPNTAFFLSGQSWYQVFWTSPSGNAYYNLAHQFMAAKLNVLSGANPTAVSSALASATTLFNTYTPAQIGALSGSDSLRKQFLSLATTLDNYNKGLIGPGHCDSEVVD
ncbi:MAG TPA: hypothetical protein VK845_07600 [Gemmatimonadales bacterium]|nr:hypothetical protein [Gemmatimonadales bacterium]